MIAWGIEVNLMEEICLNPEFSAQIPETFYQHGIAENKQMI